MTTSYLISYRPSAITRQMQLTLLSRDVFWAWLLATLFSGVPSTVILTVMGQDLWPPIHAVGTMLLPPDALPWWIFIAAAFVHAAVSLGWTVIVAAVLPVRHAIPYALAASALI